MELNCEDWMSSLPEELWDFPLTHLAIPGTEDLYLHVSPDKTHILPAGSENGTQNNAASVEEISGNTNAYKFCCYVNLKCV